MSPSSAMVHSSSPWARRTSAVSPQAPGFKLLSRRLGPVAHELILAPRPQRGSEPPEAVCLTTPYGPHESIRAEQMGRRFKPGQGPQDKEETSTSAISPWQMHAKLLVPGDVGPRLATTDMGPVPLGVPVLLEHVVGPTQAVRSRALPAHSSRTRASGLHSVEP
ncbi:hypothetical protein M8818_000091 [Zalaria obscura]|uniref:Uncharacterized protein n=1 Tax=Zalaria obscura TaxID=2024903 RepID=A0ACC3SP12_9PEZI